MNKLSGETARRYVFRGFTFFPTSLFLLPAPRDTFSPPTNGLLVQLETNTETDRQTDRQTDAPTISDARCDVQTVVVIVANCSACAELSTDCVQFNYLIPATCCIIILKVFDIPAYVSTTNFPAVIALFLLYGLVSSSCHQLIRIYTINTSKHVV